MTEEVEHESRFVAILAGRAVMGGQSVVIEVKMMDKTMMTTMR